METRFKELLGALIKEAEAAGEKGFENAHPAYRHLDKIIAERDFWKGVVQQLLTDSPDQALSDWAQVEQTTLQARLIARNLGRPVIVHVGPETQGAIYGDSADRIFMDSLQDCKGNAEGPNPFSADIMHALIETKTTPSPIYLDTPGVHKRKGGFQPPVDDPKKRSRGKKGRDNSKGGRGR